MSPMEAARPEMEEAIRLTITKLIYFEWQDPGSGVKYQG
jgi:hypothetical protein